MDKDKALGILHRTLEAHPDLRPPSDFTLSEPSAITKDHDTVYSVSWVDSNGQNAQGGMTYYIFPDDTIRWTGGGSGNLQSVDEVWSRWKLSQVAYAARREAATSPGFQDLPTMSPKFSEDTGPIEPDQTINNPQE